MTPNQTKQHPGGGKQLIFRYPNGYGASVVPEYDFTKNEIKILPDMHEIAIIRFYGDGDDDWNITYDTPLSDDVFRYMSEAQVAAVLADIYLLEKPEPKNQETDLRDLSFDELAAELQKAIDMPWGTGIPYAAKIRREIERRENSLTKENYFSAIHESVLSCAAELDNYEKFIQDSDSRIFQAKGVSELIGEPAILQSLKETLSEQENELRENLETKLRKLNSLLNKYFD